MKKLITLSVVLFHLVPLTATAGDDSLPSWQQTETKQAILDFVAAVTDEGGSDYMPPAKRIATFDNDGTLWTEKPVYIHVFALLERMKQQMAGDPTLKDRQPYKAIAARDKAYFAGLYEHRALDSLVGQLLAVPFGGMTAEAYAAWNHDWMASWRHPKLGTGVDGLIYKPMLELIRYLEANRFQVYIVTADEGAFLRLVSERIYGLPAARVQGSRVAMDYASDGARPRFVRGYRADFINNWAAKPRLIEQVIGARPILAAGNSNGDEQMLGYVAGQPGRSLALLLHHTDGEREFAYDSHTDKVLPRAAKEGWTVIDMRADWNTVFPNPTPNPNNPDPDDK